MYSSVNEIINMKIIRFSFLLFFVCKFYWGNFLIAQQNVGIGTLNPNNSAVLDVSDTAKGILIPRINLQNINLPNPVPNPAVSLLVFNTNVSIVGGSGLGFYYWNGTQWIQAFGPQGLQGITGTTGAAGPTGSSE